MEKIKSKYSFVKLAEDILPYVLISYILGFVIFRMITLDVGQDNTSYAFFLHALSLMIVFSLMRVAYSFVLHFVRLHAELVAQLIRSENTSESEAAKDKVESLK